MTRYTLSPKGQPPRKYGYSAAPPGFQGKGYCYSYTYDYAWLAKPENILAVCKPAPGKSISLTDTALIFGQGSQRLSVPLDRVKKAALEFKKLMLPLVIGGISVPLAFVALYSNILGLWAGVALVFAGAMLFYMGIRGGYQLVFELEGNSLTYFTDEAPSGARQFAAQVNHQVYLLKQKSRFRRTEGY